MAEVQTVLLFWGNEKTKMREHKLFQPEKTKLGLDLNCFFTAIPCYPTDRILQNYLSIITKPYYQHNNLRVVLLIATDTTL